MADRDYDVGYGKPPSHSRFQPGRSGNPSGRKRPRKSFGDVLEALLGEKIEINELGKTSRITKGELILRQLVNKAAGGDPRAVKLFLDVYARLQPDEVVAELAQSDEQLIADLVANLRSPAEGEIP